MSKPAISVTLVAQKDNQQLVAMAIFAVAIYFMFCVPSYAASAIASVLCSVNTMVLVDVGRGIATTAIIVLGISALMGRATWAQGLTILTGIAIIFGAPGIALSLFTAIINPALSQFFNGTIGNITAIVGCNAGIA